MRRTSGLLFLLILVLAGRPALGAGKVEIKSAGEIAYEDELIIVKGGKTAPLVAVVDERYEFSARTFQYDRRQQTGRATGAVRWRDLGAATKREIRADSVTFSAAGGTIGAEGAVSVTEQGINLQAETVRFDLRAEVCDLAGRPAKATFGAGSVTAGRISYHSGRELAAKDEVCWRSTIGGRACVVSADGYTHDFTAGRGIADGGVKAAAGDFQLSAERLSYEEAGGLITLTGHPAVARNDLRLGASCLTWQPEQELFIASGGAYFAGPVFAGQADELRYLAAEGRIHLAGTVRITRGQDVLTGNEIVYDLAAGRMQVVGEAKAAILLED